MAFWDKPSRKIIAGVDEEKFENKYSSKLNFQIGAQIITIVLCLSKTKVSVEQIGVLILSLII